MVFASGLVMAPVFCRSFLAGGDTETSQSGIGSLSSEIDDGACRNGRTETRGMVTMERTRVTAPQPQDDSTRTLFLETTPNP
jgi:hypothetical protein